VQRVRESGSQGWGKGKHMKRLNGAYLWAFLMLASAMPALAADPSGDVTKVTNFVQNVIQVLVTFSGLLAAGFFVMGGIGYITSSGNPEHLDKAKRTVVYSGLGLAVSIGAFVISGAVSGIAGTAFN